jgi:uncharacterized protein YbjT (DUF2867 family)
VPQGVGCGASAGTVEQRTSNVVGPPGCGRHSLERCALPMVVVMMKTLVVGANGQLGSACCRALLDEGHTVKGLVRRRERGAGLARDGVVLVEADLAKAVDLGRLLEGVDAVFLTANSAAPRKGDDPRALARGVARLVDAVGAAGVRRIVLPSLPESPVEDRVPMAAERRALESRVLAAAPDSVILRLPPFMEAWIALVGSSIPLRGEPNATMGRPSPFLRAFRRATGTLVERRGIMLVPGPTHARQSFIAIPDVARAMVAAQGRAELGGQVLEVGGPQVLTWEDVARTFSVVPGRLVRPISTPAGVYGAMALVLRPFTVPSRTMRLNQYVATSESAWPPGGGLVDPERMTTLEQFLREKAALPEALPTVA